MESGQKFGSYHIIKLLGQGGMGEVYLAKDLRLNRQVAIKIISPSLEDDKVLPSRFLREAKLSASLSHPNICTIHEVGQIDGQLYICMEYVEGKTLRDLIAERPLSVREVLDISIQMADALDEARRKNVVHRDIKSGNILLNARNQVKVVDFGLAKQIRSGDDHGSQTPTESSITQTGGVRGTVAYMAPEQALGKEIDHRSDIFSLGVVLYEMLTGRLPFKGESVTEVIDAILHKAPVPPTRFNDEVPTDLIRVLNKMLEKDPDVRYQSVHEVWVDLRRIRDDMTFGQSLTQKVEVKPRHGKKLLPAIALLLIAALAAVSIYFYKKQTPPSLPDVSLPLKKTVSLAVLPFQYQGVDRSKKYIGNLVTDALIASLQAAPDLSLAPYANVREISSDARVSDVVRDLGVSWIVRGTVTSKGEDIQVTHELVSSNGNTVAKQTSNGNIVQTVNTAIGQILKALPVSSRQTKDVEQVRTPNVDAYQKYLEGRNRFQGWDVESNLDEAVALYREALNKDPDFAAAQAGLAIALIAQFHKKNEPALLSSARESAQRALTLDPNLPEALLAYGTVQAETGNSIEATDALRRGLQLAPGDDAACRMLASSYASLGRNKEAKEMYQRAIGLRPSYWVNHYSLGLFNYQNAGDLEGARVELQKAYELHPEGFAPLIVLGIIDLIQGDLDQAEIYFRKTLELSHNQYAYNNLGLIYYYRGQYDLALRNWQTLLNDAPGRPIYRANVADALRQLGRRDEATLKYQQAIIGFREAVKTNPSDDNNRAGMAMALAAIGECKEATEQTRGVLARHPNSPDLSGYSAITASRCGQFDWARQIVLNSISVDNLLTIRFDPDLASIRQLPEIKTAMKRASPAAAKSTTASAPQ